MILNCTGHPVRFFSFYDMAEESNFPEIFYFLYGADYFIVVLDYFFCTLFLLLSCRIKIWHTNMTVIMGFFVWTFYLFATGRLVMLGLDITGNGVDNCSQVFYYAWYLQIFFTSTVVHAIPSVVFERWAAYYFLRDYEGKSRLFVSILIITIGSAIGLFFIASAMYGLLSQATVYIYGVVLSVASFLSFLYLWKKNKDKLKTLDHFESYSVSQRFQLEENIRVFKLLRNLVITICVLAILMIALRAIVPIYIHQEGYLQTPLILIQNAVLIVSIWSIEPWRKAMIRLLPFTKASITFVVDVTPASEAGQLYFRSLSDSWNSVKK